MRLVPKYSAAEVPDHGRAATVRERHEGPLAYAHGSDGNFLPRRGTKSAVQGLVLAVLGTCCSWFLPFTAFLCALGAWGLACAQETAPEAELPKGVIAVPLKVFANRLFIPITLNGEATCEGLLDTGSEVTLINKARVKLTKPRLGTTQQLEGAFVGGLGAQRVTLDSLAIGAYMGKEVPAAQIEQRKGQKLELI